jgi:alanine-glyoxylate transaminase/serine-glyoxylate transaminase/serine-pyruvate transaminase
MAQIIEQVKLMTRYVFQTETGHILVVVGPSSAAMEMAERVKANVVRLVVQEGQRADPEVVADYIAQHQTQGLPIVQGETSSTVCKTNLAAIAAAEKAHNCLVIVDAICTLSTMEFDMNEWGIDAVITGGQKGLSCIPECLKLIFPAKLGNIFSRAHNLFCTLHAFGASFNILGQKLDLPTGMAALESSLGQPNLI